jgi:glycosyltransferase involved in cell wall biosynthesis
VANLRLALVASLLPSDSPGGAEAYVEAAATSLAERHDVVVLTGSRGAGIDGIRTLRLPGLPVLDSAAPLPRRVLWHALDQWLPPVHVALNRELKRVRPDVVLTHHPQGLSAAVFSAVAARRLPHVHTAHDLNVLCARTSMTRDGRFCGGWCAACLVQRGLRGGAIRLRLDRLVAASTYVLERHVRARIVARSRAELIRLGAAPGHARLRRIEGAAVTLGFIGTLRPHKGVLTLLEAFSKTSAPWQLIVAGSGELEQAVRAAARADARIAYVGHVGGLEKDRFFDSLDLVVIPSEWEEPATFVAVEAAVRGIPAIVSNRGGLPETPESRTFRSGDASELLRAIEWFVSDPRRLEQASTRLHAHSERFKWSTHVRRLEALLAEVAGERRPA